ncbi:MAG: hypothetical protein ABIA47_02235 [bacterium]
MQLDPNMEDNTPEGKKEVRIGGKPLPKGLPNILTGVVAIIVVLLLFAILKPAPISENGNGEMDDEEHVLESETSNFIYTALADWGLAERATAGIQTLTSGQVIEEGIVQDPADENIVYFAASAYDSFNNQNLVSIYSYRNDNHNFERIFRTTYALGGCSYLTQNAVPSFHVVGYEERKLILLVKDIGGTFGECENLLTYGFDNPDTSNFVTLSLDDTYGGFGEFSPGEALMSEAEATKADCEGPVAEDDNNDSDDGVE